MLTDDDPMPFGKHKGTPMIDVPSSYLDWLDDQPWLHEKFPDMADYIKRSRKAIDQDLERNDQ